MPGAVRTAPSVRSLALVVGVGVDTRLREDLVDLVLHALQCARLRGIRVVHRRCGRGIGDPHRGLRSDSISSTSSTTSISSISSMTRGLLDLHRRRRARRRRSPRGAATPVPPRPGRASSTAARAANGLAPAEGAIRVEFGGCRVPGARVRSARGRGAHRTWRWRVRHGRPPEVSRGRRHGRLQRAVGAAEAPLAVDEKRDLVVAPGDPAERAHLSHREGVVAGRIGRDGDGLADDRNAAGTSGRSEGVLMRECRVVVDQGALPSRGGARPARHSPC